MTHTLHKIASLCFLGMLLTFGTISVKAQSTSHCINADFELGDFTNWQGFTGTPPVGGCCPIDVPTPGIVFGRHTIITTPGIDPNTCGGLQIMPPFVGGHVCQLGNSNVNSEAERLTYDLVVDSNNALFVYQYAVVLEDPNHTAAQQPRFQIRVLDSLGQVVDPICGQYNVVSGQNIPGFQSCANSQTVWKDWTTVGVNLVPYIGQNITLEFSTGDCSLGGHFGYAYLDAYCMPMAIQTEFCIGSSQVILAAPPGFSHYTWSNNGDTTITTVVDSPYIGQQVTVTLTTVQNCSLTLTTTLNSTVISPNYAVQISDPCNPSAAVQFFDSTTIVNGTLVGWNWNFGDSTAVDTSQNPTHNFPGPGSYQVTLYAYSLSGCVDSITTTVDLFSPANAAFSNNTACVGDATNFTDQSTAGNDVVTGWDWSFGDSNTSNVQNPSHTYANAGNYSVTLIIHTNNGCTDTLIQSVLVNALPTIITNNPPPVCLGDASPLAASGAHIYTWSPATWLSATTGSSVTSNPQDSITYTVTGTDTITGCSSSTTVFVMVNPLPIVLTPADPEVCEGGCVTLTLSGAFNYSWLNTAYITSANADSSIVDVCPAVTTIYTVVGHSQEGCTASVTFDVDVYPNPTPSISADGPTVFCAGNSVNLTVSPVNVGDTIEWSNSASTATINVNTSDVLTVTITSIHGCEGTSPPQSVTVNPIPVAQISPLGPLTICTGFPATLHAVTGAGYSYQWYQGTTPVGGNTDSLVVTTTGSYSVVVTANNCTATSNTVQAVLGLGPDVTLTQTPTIGCLQNTIYVGYGPQSVTLTAITNPPAASYLWFPDSQTTQSISITQPGSYSVIAYDINGCPSPNPAVMTPALQVIDIRCGVGKKKILLCHVPEGNPGNPQTLCLAPSAIPHHLEHHQYDCLGPCSLYYQRMEPIIDASDEDFFVMTYPNPFNNGFNIYILSSSNDEIKVNIYDMLGRVVETYRNVTEETMIGTTLTDGVYTAEVVQGDNRKMLSIIKSDK